MDVLKINDDDDDDDDVSVCSFSAVRTTALLYCFNYELYMWSEEY